MPQTLVGHGVATDVDTLNVDDGKVMLSKEAVMVSGAAEGEMDIGKVDELVASSGEDVVRELSSSVSVAPELGFALSADIVGTLDDVGIDMLVTDKLDIGRPVNEALGMLERVSRSIVFEIRVGDNVAVSNPGALTEGGLRAGGLTAVEPIPKEMSAEPITGLVIETVDKDIELMVGTEMLVLGESIDTMLLKLSVVALDDGEVDDRDIDVDGRLNASDVGDKDRLVVGTDIEVEYRLIVGADIMVDPRLIVGAAIELEGRLMVGTDSEVDGKIMDGADKVVDDRPNNGTVTEFDAVDSMTDVEPKMVWLGN